MQATVTSSLYPSLNKDLPLGAKRLFIQCSPRLMLWRYFLVSEASARGFAGLQLEEACNVHLVQFCPSLQPSNLFADCSVRPDSYGRNAASTASAGRSSQRFLSWFHRESRCCVPSSPRKQRLPVRSPVNSTGLLVLGTGGRPRKCQFEARMFRHVPSGVRSDLPGW